MPTRAATKVSVDRTGTDVDIPVFAYTGSGVPVLTGDIWSQIGTDSGWVKIGNYTGFAGSTTGIQVQNNYRRAQCKNECVTAISPMPAPTMTICQALETLSARRCIQGMRSATAM